MIDISLQERLTLAASTPSKEDLLRSWSAIYMAALEGNPTLLSEVIGSHSRLLGYKSESAMRSSRERILGTIEKVKNTIGLKCAIERAMNNEKV